MTAQASNPNLKTLEAFFEYASKGDFAGIANLYTEDFVLEMPYVNFDGLRLEGVEKVAEYMAEVGGRFKITLHLSEIYETADPDVLIAEYTSRGEFLPEKIPYDNRYITVYKFKDARICEVREFFNPLRADIELKKKHLEE